MLPHDIKDYLIYFWFLRNIKHETLVIHGTKYSGMNQVKFLKAVLRNANVTWSILEYFVPHIPYVEYILHKLNTVNLVSYLKLWSPWLPHPKTCKEYTISMKFCLKWRNGSSFRRYNYKWVSCTKSVPCPLRNQFFAILYKILGKLPLLLCFINLIVGAPFYK